MRISSAYASKMFSVINAPANRVLRKHQVVSPRLLVLYHRANPGGYGMPNPEGQLLEEVKAGYRGAVVTGHDLDVF